MALALLIGGATTANATYQLGTKYTSVASLSDKVFAIVDESVEKAFYGPTGGYGHEVGFGDYATAFTNSVNFFYFKLVDIPADEIAKNPSLADYTLIRACKADGSLYTFWGNDGNGYLNTNDGTCFLLGIVGSNENPKTLGQDFDYAAVWKVTYVDGKGFTIQNKYTENKYLKDGGAPKNDDPTYFSFYTVEESPFDTTKNHMLCFNNGAAGSNPWDHQANYTLPTALVAGKTYVFEAIINAVNGGETRLVPNGDGSQYLDTKGLWKNEFTRYQVEFTATGNHTKLEIDLGACGGEVYFDNVSLVEKGESTNLIANGDFETEGTTGWSGSNNTFDQVENELGTIKDPGILISVGEAGWRTFRTGSPIEITDPSVKAYVAKYVAEGNYVKLTEVTKVPGWQPVLIEAPEGKYMVDIPENADGFPWGENGLQANGDKAKPGDGTLYGLAKKNGKVGFYKIASTSEVPAWAIYLQIPAASAPDFLGFDGGSTSISELNVKGQVNGEVFNLAGQRVAQPAKGLYIVNGKKVIFK